MYRNHTIGVVVTAYNEEGLVGDVISRMPRFVDRVYAVDDCSTDGTWDEITQHAATPVNETVTSPVPDGGRNAEQMVVPIRHETNQGVGGAIKSGFEHALEDRVDIVAVMDGDGQMDPAHLHRLLDPIIDGKATYAKGNRLSRMSHFRGMSPLRVIGNLILTALTRIASGYWRMSDPQNGYNAISRSALERLSISDLYSGYGFRNDILVHLNVQQAIIADVAMPAIYGEEESGIRYSNFVPRMSGLLLRRFLWRLHQRYMSKHGSFESGLSAAVISVLAGVILLTRTLSRKRSLFSRISTVGMVFGGLLMALAMAESRHANDATVVVGEDE
ncbi:glycosyltransferase family 2 protein [Halocatena marina]|uniref:Glycosyltransferase family 2 protein n=1 Tax=Halocatena marina TaxID=2934937 RepID=A0ABD5YI70_9EURY|nr:glycosyltransferase family 2 protein [Halocatena marina]